MFRLDDLDKKLISELQQNAYRTNTELSRFVGTSKSTATRRIRRLLDNDVIKIIGVVDPGKTGLGTEALICLKVNLCEIDDIVERLSGSNQINLISLMTGRYDIVLRVTVDSPTELADFLRREISTIDGIKDIETLLALEVKKRTHALRL